MRSRTYRKAQLFTAAANQRSRIFYEHRGWRATAVVVGRVYARGKESGLELDSGWSAVVRFRDGTAISAWDWLDRDEALKAVGLEE